MNLALTLLLAASSPSVESGPATVTARASARIVAGVAIYRQSSELPDGPHVRVTRRGDGQVWLEFE